MEAIDKIRRNAARFARKLKHGYYLEDAKGTDRGEYCPRCAIRLIAAKRKAGEAWAKYTLDASSDHDVRCACNTCGRFLYGRLTEYGAREELWHFEEHGFDIDSPDDCYSWELCEGTWLKESDEYRRLLALVGITTAEVVQ